MIVQRILDVAIRSDGPDCHDQGKFPLNLDKKDVYPFNVQSLHTFPDLI